MADVIEMVEIVELVAVTDVVDVVELGNWTHPKVTLQDVKILLAFPRALNREGNSKQNMPKNRVGNAPLSNFPNTMDQ